MCDEYAGKKSSQGDLFRITAELGNMSLNPGQEKLFCRIPEVSVLRCSENHAEAKAGGRENSSIEMILTVVQADIGGSSGESFFSGEPAESIHAVVEVYIDDWFAELN